MKTTINYSRISQSSIGMSKTAQVSDIYKFGEMYAANIDFQRRE